MKSAVQQWVAPGVFFILLALTQTPHINSDALEMGQVGAGFFGADTQGLSWTHYPPLAPLISGFLALVLGTAAALVAVNLFCMVGLVWLIQRMVTNREVTVLAGFSVVLVGMGIGPVREMSMSADPRALQLVLIFSCLALLKSDSTLFHKKLLGVLAALLLMCRPEGLLFGGLLLGGAVWLWRRTAVSTLVFFFGMVLPYFLWIFRQVGSLTLSTRAWELKGASLLTDFPVRPLVHLWGAGATTTPFRLLLEDVEGSAALPSVGLFSALVDALNALCRGLSPVWLALAILGSVLVWRRSRFLFVMLSGVFGGALAMYWVPMGRDEAQPLLNLMPAVVVIWVWASLGAVALVEWAQSKTRLPKMAIGFAVLGPVSLMSVFSDSSSPGNVNANQASAWLLSELPQDSRIASSLGSSGIVRRSGLNWERVPARWERPKVWTTDSHPDYLLLSSVDGSWMLGPPLFPGELPLVPRAYFGDASNWVLLLDLEASWRQMNDLTLDYETLDQGNPLDEAPGPLEEIQGQLPGTGTIRP
jgi:hypothetical protein